jgi:hypothetical protein
VHRVQQWPFTVGVASGESLIARFGDVVMYVGSSEQPAAELLAAAAAAARAPRPGDVLPERLAPITSGAARHVSFGIVAPGVDGLLILLRGAVIAEIETSAGKQRLSGGDRPTWVSKTVRDQELKVTISSSTNPVRATTRHTDLWGGVVPGGGFILLPTAADSSPQSKDVLTERIPSRHTMTATVPIGAAIPAETAVHTAPSAVLAAKDGAIYTLDRAYVIGRAPLNDEAVRNATASPIVVPYDPSVSRVHAYITVGGGAVFVRDASTAAGTFVAAPGSETWTRIGETPTRLEPGWSLRIGEWIATHRLEASV